MKGAKAVASKKSAAKVASQRMDDSSETLVVGPYDVLCTRSKAGRSNIGNRRLQVLCQLNSETYAMAESRSDKSIIIAGVVDIVRSAGGRFLRRNSNTHKWEVAPPTTEKEKVGQTLRQCVATIESSMDASNDASDEFRQVTESMKAPSKVPPAGNVQRLPSFAEVTIPVSNSVSSAPSVPPMTQGDKKHELKMTNNDSLVANMKSGTMYEAQKNVLDDQYEQEHPDLENLVELNADFDYFLGCQLDLWSESCSRC